MKELGTMLLSREPFSEIVIGNTAIVRAMLETGTKVVTSYPGSPTPEIASAIAAIPRAERPFYFEFSTNEKVAMEVAYGAALNGHPAAVFFKSVGLNVAADMFMQLALSEITGGLVVAVGDDPGAHSSQNEQDNRFYAKMAHVPMLEPATPTEIYEYYIEGMALARKHKMPILLRLSTHSCHQKEKVHFSSYRPPADDWTQPAFELCLKGEGTKLAAGSIAIDEHNRYLYVRGGTSRGPIERWALDGADYYKPVNVAAGSNQVTDDLWYGWFIRTGHADTGFDVAPDGSLAITGALGSTKDLNLKYFKSSEDVKATA